VASNRQRNFGFLTILSIIWKTGNLSASTAGDNFDELKIGRAA
jgi:hypothetical protein